MSPEEFAEALDVSHETLRALECYAERLKKWQAKINLVGSATLPDIWRRHFLDSGQLVPLHRERHPDQSAPVWVDLGSGAGFPGLVISLLSGWTVHLIEKSAKKCAFMRQVIRETSAPAIVHQGRIEGLDLGQADVVTSRALAPTADLIEMSAPFLHEETEIWLLKGQHVDEELTKASISWNMQTEIINSLSDPTGRIVRIRNLSRVQAG